MRSGSPTMPSGFHDLCKRGRAHRHRATACPLTCCAPVLSGFCPPGTGFLYSTTSMKSSSFAIPLLLLSACDLTLASRLGIYARPRSKQLSGAFARRASIVGNTSVSNVGDVEYLTDITLGGKKFSVQIDTGRYVVALSVAARWFILCQFGLVGRRRCPERKGHGQIGQSHVCGRRSSRYVVKTLLLAHLQRVLQWPPRLCEAQSEDTSSAYMP